MPIIEAGEYQLLEPQEHKNLVWKITEALDLLCISKVLSERMLLGQSCLKESESER